MVSDFVNGSHPAAGQCTSESTLQVSSQALYKTGFWSYLGLIMGSDGPACWLILLFLHREAMHPPREPNRKISQVSLGETTARSRAFGRRTCVYSRYALLKTQLQPYFWTSPEPLDTPFGAVDNLCLSPCGLGVALLQRRQGEG